ncbi:bifunctional DNA-formamidopyrimidine glycosylase/DNA-(apurinic or apyrimidinic site) lyase [Agaribacterium haliotis]|uniref:bifunctional DNA-formamidopyrimidine glycosylase/DNA-(apurinic or apyrimidinic site) lyase n=1 Tax=Agaribacterium haliotis TaxID=2013869 RepID=UPI000BB59AE3|nr:bifunctional DNA-formamidopyrimidine glycosylase/DNA-(apurinic or apyrimidinic site) lyase [Agaribacterium haliotis]
MPELPEVETTKAGVAPYCEGKKLSKLIVRNPNLRWPVPEELASKIEGKKLLDLSRRGKYLLFRFNNGTALLHLGMSGNLRVIPTGSEPGKHDHVELCFGKQSLRFNDPRRFGCLLWTEDKISEHPLINHLGPEPLSEAFDAELLYNKTRKRSQAIKTFIMDSKIVVGVGNIYANEALFAAGIHPTKAAGKLSKAKCELLVEEIKKVLAAAIKQGGTTLKDFVGGDGKPGYFAQKLKVYGRGGEPCVVCDKALTEKQISTRTTVYCTNCQK